MSININPVRCPVCGDTFHGAHQCRPVVTASPPIPVQAQPWRCAASRSLLAINLSDAELAKRLADTISPPWLELYRDERLRRAALKLKKRRGLQ